MSTEQRCGNRSQLAEKNSIGTRTDASKKLKKENFYMPNVEINVIDYDPSDRMALIARQTYPDHILASSVRSMVDGVIGRLGSVRSSSGEPAVIGRLRILGHGEPGLQAIGNSHSTQNPRQFIGLDYRGHLYNRDVLMQLRGRFAPDARVELHGCNTGLRGQPLRSALEQLWGVRVFSSSATQYSSTPGLEYLSS